MNRCLAAWAGAIVVIAWAVLTAIAYRRRPVPADVPEDDVQPWDMPTSWTFVAGPSVTVKVDDTTTERPN